MRASHIGGSADCRLTRVYRDPVSGRKIRATVHRDEYDTQSSARADVLTPALTWTELATFSPLFWHASASSAGNYPEAVVESLGWIADDLARRAQRILLA